MYGNLRIGSNTYFYESQYNDGMHVGFINFIILFDILNFVLFE